MAGGNGRHHAESTRTRAWGGWSRFTRYLIILSVIAIYLNIGWLFSSYLATYIVGHEPQTFWQTLWGGWGGTLTSGPDGTSFIDQIVMVMVMVFWPAYAITILGSWVAYGLYWLLWLVFAGGIVKLLGLA